LLIINDAPPGVNGLLAVFGQGRGRKNSKAWTRGPTLTH
jgi:hypothetical protein